MCQWPGRVPEWARHQQQQPAGVSYHKIGYRSGASAQVSRGPVYTGTRPIRGRRGREWPMRGQDRKQRDNETSFTRWPVTLNKPLDFKKMTDCVSSTPDLTLWHHHPLNYFLPFSFTLIPNPRSQSGYISLSKLSWHFKIIAISNISHNPSKLCQSLWFDTKNKK